MNRGLIIFAREPLPGKVKTRLGRAVGNNAAAELYGAMLADVLEQAATLPGIRPLLYWACEGDGMPPFPDVPGLEMFRQAGATLGQRMANAFESAFKSGSDVCCIIGTDSPDLPPEYISRAFDLLCQGEADVVFGPAEDGGYYLLGMGRTWPGLFRDIPWGTPQVLAASIERARLLGLRTALLPQSYDIDTLSDLLRLLDSPGNRAPRTREAAHGVLKEASRQQTDT